MEVPIELAYSSLLSTLNQTKKKRKKGKKKEIFFKKIITG